MEKEKIGLKSVSLTKIELNDSGDYITVSADSPAFFDGFAAGYKQIMDLADSIPGKLDEIEKKYDGKEDFADTMDKALEATIKVVSRPLDWARSSARCLLVIIFFLLAQLFKQGF